VDYAYIESQRSQEIIKGSAPAHISVPPANDEIWDKIQTRLEPSVRRSHFGNITQREFRIIQETYDASSVNNLISGTINLINTIIDRHHKEVPVNTLLFMDKSARNGYYVFNILWDAYSKLGKIPKMYKPDIKFLNISQYDHSKNIYPGSLALLKNKLNQRNFSRNILVVDDSVLTGDSMRMTINTISDLFQHRPDGIEQFANTPSWYGEEASGVIGVTDPSDKHHATYKKISQQPVDQILAVNKIIDTIGERQFTNLAKLIFSLPDHSNVPFSAVSNEDFAIVKSFIFQCQLNKIPDAVSFFHTAGGFFVSSLPEKSLHENARAYRRILKQICSLYLQSQKKQG